MVGDRLDTDIAFGLAGGLTTLCVLTGVVKMSDIDDQVAKAGASEVDGAQGDAEDGTKPAKRKRVEGDGATVPTFVVDSLGSFEALVKEQ